MKCISPFDNESYHLGDANPGHEVPSSDYKKVENRKENGKCKNATNSESRPVNFLLQNRQNMSLVSVLSQSRLKSRLRIPANEMFSTSNLFSHRKSNYRIFRQIKWNSYFFWSGSIKYNFRIIFCTSRLIFCFWNNISLSGYFDRNGTP